MPPRLSIGIFLASAMHILAVDSTSLTAIGLVRASGEFTIDGSRARDNSTVFQGSVISTTNAASHIVLEDGTRIDMGLDSRSRIYRDHVTIEQGLAQVSASNRYAVIAEKIRIDSPLRTLVRVTDSRTVAVAALQGVTEVKNGKGIPVAMVPPGKTLEFGDSQTPAGEVAVTGCLERIEGKSGNPKAVHFLLQDQTTNVIAELVGPGLERLAGMKVTAAGPIDPATKATSPASETIRVRDLNALSRLRCKGQIAGATPVAPGVPTAPVGIVAGVAVIGTVGSLGLAGVIGGGAEQTTPSAASQ